MPAVRFEPRRLMWLVVGTCLVVVALATLAIVEAVRQDEPVAAAFPLLAAVPAVVGMWLGARAACLGVTVDDVELTAPRPVRGRRHLALADIAGVGLHYIAAGRGSGWRPYAWPAEGSPIRLSIEPPSHSAPKGRRGLRRPRTGQAPALDWNYVADSSAGRALMVISARVMTVQGEAGLWARSRREATVETANGLHTAYWSPDGQLGPLPGAVGRHENRSGAR